MMLGIHSLLPEFFDTLKFLLSLKQTVGIIGGKPRMALFLVGFTKDSLIVLDPHLVQTAPRSENEFKSLLGSYHCRSPIVIPFEEIEGSFSLGLYFKDELSWLDFEEKIKDKRCKGVIMINEHETEDIQGLIDFDLNISN